MKTIFVVDELPVEDSNGWTFRNDHHRLRAAMMADALNKIMPRANAEVLCSEYEGQLNGYNGPYRATSNRDGHELKRVLDGNVVVLCGISNEHTFNNVAYAAFGKTRGHMNARALILDPGLECLETMRGDDSHKYANSFGWMEFSRRANLRITSNLQMAEAIGQGSVAHDFPGIDTIIPDPVEMPFEPARFAPGENLKILMQLHAHDITALKEALPALARVAASRPVELGLMAMSERMLEENGSTRSKLEAFAEEAAKAGIAVTAGPWTPLDEIAAHRWCDMVIAPRGPDVDTFARCEGPAVVHRALANGRWVVASDAIPAFNDPVPDLPNVPNSQLDLAIFAALADPAQAELAITEAQGKLEARAPETVAQMMWDEVLSGFYGPERELVRNVHDEIACENHIIRQNEQWRKRQAEIEKQREEARKKHERERENRRAQLIATTQQERQRMLDEEELDRQHERALGRGARNPAQQRLRRSRGMGMSR